ncbi:MAG: hypothetical protein QOJ91_1336 [Sphingomonadales bacterium]|jgi:hypothetical protein|nr:hypothetical protein [Sphingomonadales bacterium]
MRAAAILLALAAAGAARAGPTVEIEPRTEAFASRAACEQALEQRHSAALSRLAALDRKGGNKVTPLKRDGGEQLSYAERVDLGAGDPESGISDSQTEQFTCRGNLLEHRIDFGAG